jgi:hypothetical protein
MHQRTFISVIVEEAAWITKNYGKFKNLEIPSSHNAFKCEPWLLTSNKPLTFFSDWCLSILGLHSAVLITI